MKDKGFTLIELLVVIAVIGVLSSIVLTALANSRSRAGDAAIKTALSHARTSAEIYQSTNDNYNAGAAVYTDTCGTPVAGVDLLNDSSFQTQIDDAIVKSGQSGAKCVATGANYVAAVPLKSDPNSAWCIDNAGASTKITYANFTAVTDINCVAANTP